MGKEVSNRLVYIDALRGLAILLVVVGHLVQYNFKDGIHNDIFNVIYSFHMPLFFFISGYVRAIKKNVLEDIKGLFYTTFSKFKHLIIPSISWTLLVPLFFSNKFCFNGQVSGYWFLNSLFVISVLSECYLFLYNRIRDKWRVTLNIICSLAIVGCFIIGFKRISMMYLVLYIMGYVVNKYELVHKLPPYLASIFFILFLLSTGYFKYGDYIAGAESRVWLELPISIFASLSLMWLFYVISIKYSRFFLSLSFIGKNTLGIYLCQFFLVKADVFSWVGYVSNNLIQFCILIICAVAISYLCIGIKYMLSFFPILMALLYGESMCRKTITLE